MSSLSESLAQFIRDLDITAIPANVIEYSKILLLDTLGAGLAGVHTIEGSAMIEAARHFSGETGECAIWGTVRRTGRASAALINGTLSHAQDLDDFGGCDHSGAVVIPAVLAACENTNASGSRVLEAIVAGYDVAFRALEGTGGYQTHTARGWHSTGTCGSFGAAAAVAKTLDLPLRETVWALGLAGSYTGGIWAFQADNAMSKRYHIGRAAENGVVSGFLAQQGFTGPAQIFEASWGGFLPMYAGDDVRPIKILDGLGTDFKIRRSGIKPYACCRDIHSTLDIVCDLYAKQSLRADLIESMRVECTLDMMRLVGGTNTSTRQGAQMSLPFSVAVASIAGGAALTHYERKWREDDRVQNLMTRVTMEVRPDLPKGSEPIVIITTKDGRTFKDQIPYARGAPENPLSRDEVLAKYQGLASCALSDDGIQMLQDAVLALEEPGSLSRLFLALQHLRATEFEHSDR